MVSLRIQLPIICHFDEGEITYRLSNVIFLGRLNSVLILKKLICLLFFRKMTLAIEIIFFVVY